MAGTLHDRLCARELHVCAKAFCHVKVGAANEQEAQFGRTDLLEELCVATPFDVDVEVLRCSSEYFAIQCVCGCESVERRRHGCADIGSAVLPPPLLAKLPIQIRERLAQDRIRSLLTQLGSQSLDERNQNPSLDLDLFDQRNVRTSLLFKRN